MIVLTFVSRSTRRRVKRRRVIEVTLRDEGHTGRESFGEADSGLGVGVHGPLRGPVLITPVPLGDGAVVCLHLHDAGSGVSHDGPDPVSVRLENDRLLRRSGPFPGAVRSVRDFAVRHASPLSQKPSNNRSSHDGELVGIKRPGGRPLAVIGLSFRSRLHPAAWLTSRGPRCGSAVRQGFSGRRVRGDVPGAWLSECAQQSPQPSPDRNVYRDSSFSASGRSSPADDTCR
jgi:hypothetical protein